MVGLLGLVDRVRGLIDRLTWPSTERAHEEMERATWQTETGYYRFDVEESDRVRETGRVEEGGKA